jgi:hypothetical protein
MLIDEYPNFQGAKIRRLLRPVFFFQSPSPAHHSQQLFIIQPSTSLAVNSTQFPTGDAR